MNHQQRQAFFFFLAFFLVTLQSPSTATTLTPQREAPPRQPQQQQAHDSAADSASVSMNRATFTNLWTRQEPSFFSTPQQQRHLQQQQHQRRTQDKQKKKSVVEEASEDEKLQLQLQQQEPQEEVCRIHRECDLCTTSDMATVAQCEPTGKTEIWSCVTTNDQGVEFKGRKETRSCHRTRAEEDYMLVQFQVACLLLGSFMYRTVKRQRLLFVSGFDQRRQQQQQQSDLLSVRTSASERVPLTSDDSGIEVV